MRYLLLLAVEGPAHGLVEPDGAAQGPVVARYRSLLRELEDAGMWCGGDALQPATSVTGVRVRDRRVILRDGRFVGTTDHLVGYCVVDCDDLDHAIDVSSRIPIAEHGSIEIWPVHEDHAAMRAPLRG
jgi:hypothetical protein